MITELLHVYVTYLGLVTLLVGVCLLVAGALVSRKIVDWSASWPELWRFQK